MGDSRYSSAAVHVAEGQKTITQQQSQHASAAAAESFQRLPQNHAHAFARDSATPSPSSGAVLEARPASTATISKVERDAFSALDTEAAARHVWSHATANKAEAGFQDPALGWVRVRAQIDSTGVHATVVPASASAGQTLGEHLNGLATYLSDHHTRVETWAVSAPESSGEIKGADQQGEQAMRQGGGQGQQSSSGDKKTDGAEPWPTDTHPMHAEARQTTLPITLQGADTGRYISLMV